MKIILASIVFLSAFQSMGQAQVKVEEFFVLDGHKEGISSLAFSPDGATLVSGSQDESLKIWDVATKKEKKTIGKLGSAPTSLVFSPKGEFLAAGSYGVVTLYETGKWKKKAKQKVLAAFLENLAVSPDGKQLAVSSWKDQSLATLDFPSLSNLKEWKETNWTDALSYSKNGEFLLTGSHSNAIKVWDPKSGTVVNQFQNHSDWVYGCSFMAGNQKIISAALDSHIVVTDARTGKILMKKKGHSDGISYGLLSPDEKVFVTVSLDKTLKIWDSETLELLAAFTEPKEKLVTLALSPDGKWIATGGSDDKVYLLRIR